tara:strand:- start:918 stop:1358 length:441 start_codon:yes stop_codon:yes gene_type:complete
VHNEAQHHTVSGCRALAGSHRYAMKICQVFVGLLAIVATGCAGIEANSPVSLRGEENSYKYDQVVLEKALKKAQTWSNIIYGKDCVVCAELLPDPSKSRFELHITSPGDLLFNTSATMEFRKSDGKVIDKSIYHSCKVHYKSENDA